MYVCVCVCVCVCVDKLQTRLLSPRRNAPVSSHIAATHINEAPLLSLNTLYVRQSEYKRKYTGVCKLKHHTTRTELFSYIKVKAISRLDRPLEFQKVEAPKFPDIWNMKVIRLSVLRTGRL